MTTSDGAEAACPACAASHPDRDSYISFCSACGHRWLASSAEEHRAREDEIFGFDYSGYTPDERFVSFARDFTANQLRARIPANARILDVGCGSGDFMQVAKQLGYEVEGIDVSKAAAEICRSKGLKARAGDFLTEEFDGKFDLITMWDVVEHLFDPASFLTRSSELLTDRGLLFTKIPGFGNLSVRLSQKVPRFAGILLGAPDHVQFFDRNSLERLLRRANFSAEWLPGGAIRTPTQGGSLKRRAGRAAQRVLKAASGDRNLFVLARPA